MINPLGVVPIFISLTDSFSTNESRKIAIKASTKKSVAKWLIKNKAEENNGVVYESEFSK